MKKFLKGTQEKAMAIFLPLTRLWYIVKEERSLIPENDDEAAAEHNGIALFFEQTVFLVGQAFNSLDDQRRLRQSSTLVDNNARVKEVLKE